MKSLIVFLSLITSSLALSSEVVLSTKAENGYYFTAGDFAVNEELGRAWTVLTFSDLASEPRFDEERIQVKGMSFDKTTQEVIMEDESGRTVCAVKRKALLGARVLRPTGNCIFTKIRFTITSDDGFEVRTIKKMKVSLVY